uniref:G-protein coupled receptors family 1 profile domain-containing protein n=1 Tax=Wuchereria bancrofti TaxID=6293 RepID=A0AAF5PKX2_WUCBA
MIFFFAIYGLTTTLFFKKKFWNDLWNISMTDIIISIVSGTITPITLLSKIWIFGELLCYFIPLIQITLICFFFLTFQIFPPKLFFVISDNKQPIQKPQAVKIIGLNFALATQRFIKYENLCGQFCTEDWDSDNVGRSTYETNVLPTTSTKTTFTYKSYANCNGWRVRLLLDASCCL